MSSIVLKWNDLDLSTICGDLQRADSIDAPYGGRGSMDGGVAGQPRLMAKSFNFTGSIQASSAANLRTAVDALRSGLFCEPRQGKLWIYNDRYYNAVCSAFTEPDFSEGLLNYDVAFSFLAADGFEIEAIPTRVAGSDISESWTGFVLYGAAPDSYKHLCYRVSNGGITIWPKINLETYAAALINPIYLQRRGRNLLLNPSFEIVAVGLPGKYWTYWTTGSGIEIPQLYDSYDGDRCVRFENTVNEISYIRQYVPVGKAFDGKVLTLSAFIRLVSLTGSGVGVQITQLKADGSAATASTNTYITSPSDWVCVSSPPTTIHTNTRYLVVDIVQAGSGVMMIDAVQLEEAPAATTFTNTREKRIEYVGASIPPYNFLGIDMENRRVLLNGGTDEIAHMAEEFWNLEPGINMIWLSHHDTSGVAPGFTLSYNARRP